MLLCKCVLFLRPSIDTLIKSAFLKAHRAIIGICHVSGENTSSEAFVSPFHLTFPIHDFISHEHDSLGSVSTLHGCVATLGSETKEPMIRERMFGCSADETRTSGPSSVVRYPGGQMVRNPEIPHDVFPAFRLFFSRSAFRLPSKTDFNGPVKDRLLPWYYFWLL